MSAPSIPNLLSRRGGGSSGGGGGGRGSRGGGSSRLRNRVGSLATPADTAIRGTDNDAADSRFSAVNLGYLADPYAQHFIAQDCPPPARRLPIINRGTYTRTKAIDAHIQLFLSAPSDSLGDPQPPALALEQFMAAQCEPGERQIISLGAGTDTRPFRIFATGRHRKLIYHEIDFETSSRAKLHTVEATAGLSRIMTDAGEEHPHTWTAQPINGGEYFNHGIDLRELGRGHAEEIYGLRTDIPTLLLSECCLCYLEPEDSDRVLRYFMSRLRSLAIVIYEPIHLDDAFGDTMVSNLATRNIHMPGMMRYRNPAAQIQRLRDIGCNAADCLTVASIWDVEIPNSEKERLKQLEGLDEEEEWKLLAGHYVIAWGGKFP